jgi:hypothetical protein
MAMRPKAWHVLCPASIQSIKFCINFWDFEAVELDRLGGSGENWG